MPQPKRTCSGPAVSPGPVVGAYEDNGDVTFHYVEHATGMKVVCTCDDGNAFPFRGARGYAQSLQIQSLKNSVEFDSYSSPLDDGKFWTDDVVAALDEIDTAHSMST